MVFRRSIKITTLFWIAILALILTTIYSSFLIGQGIKAEKMIKYIYQKVKNKEIK